MERIGHNGDAPDRYLSSRVLFQFTSTNEAMQDAFSMHFAKYGLSSAKFKLLVHLYMTGGRGLTQSELSKKLMVSRANITGLIERLEKEDLVVRGDDPSDKRVFRVCLTDRAVTLMDSFLPIHNDFMHNIISVLDKSEKELFITLLEKIEKGLDAI